ncbi:recombinase family protein [Sphingomonas sp. HMP6]|uniref:recombinase family protein n=1 Tax=Sphingomonas sp. HMP6 TaxID=1517551 RepID=UPI00159702C2|nr:recombinase family protein [Sphingomonas sp. HMP6]BCA59487.1 hypothetical protein HMP06_2256 [Sphingomonas sp. HMP6]
MTTSVQIERALGYFRTSSQTQASEGTGVDKQEADLRDYYRGQSIDLVAIYRDSAVAGTTDNHTALQALIEHAIRPGSGVTEIGVCSLSRLSRDPDLLDEVRRTLERASIRLVAISEVAGQATSNILVRSTETTL